jgi:hypothetical protein
VRICLISRSKLTCPLGDEGAFCVTWVIARTGGEDGGFAGVKGGMRNVENQFEALRHGHGAFYADISRRM